MPSDIPESTPQNLPTVRRRPGRKLGQILPDDRPRTYNKIPKFSGADIKRALNLNYGNSQMAADALNQAEQKAGGPRSITRSYIDKFIQSRGLRNIIRADGRETILDMAEKRVFNAIRGGDSRNARWLLEQLGADRGYGRNVDIGDLMIIDPRNLTDEQLIRILDPANLSESQLDLVLRMLNERFSVYAGGTVIDHEGGE